MKFYLGDRSNEVQVLIRPILTRCKDETFDSMTVTLKANNRALPYEPKQNFIIDMETDPQQTLCFVVESDEVALFSTSPLLYKHTLSLIEKKKYLQYHLVRNSSFTNEPENYEKKLATAVASSILNGTQGVYDSELDRYYDTYAPIGNSWTNPSIKSITGPVKNVSAYITYNANFFYFYGIENDTATLSSINGDFSSIAEVNDFFNEYGDVLYSDFVFNGSIIVRYTTVDNESRQVTLTSQELGIPLTDNNFFGKKYRCERIEQILNSGAKDVSIEPATAGMITSDGLLWSTTNTRKKPIAFNCIVDIDLEYGSQKSCYDILDLLLKRQRKDTSKTESTNTNLFNLPNALHYPELKTLLENTDAPNFYFSQATMYECVAEVFRIFDATFTIDEDNYINIDYFNQKTRKINIDNQIVGINQNIGADKFSNGIVTHYQDARTLEIFPGSNTYIKPRSQKLGVPDLADHCILLPHKIHQLKKAILYNYGVIIDTGSGPYAIGERVYPCSLPLDITDWVIESSIWSGLSTSNLVEYDKKKQNNTISYEKNGKVIHLGHTYNDAANRTYYAIENLLDSAFKTQMGAPGATGNEFTNSVSITAWYSQNFRVEYYTTVNGKTRVDSLQYKYNGDELVDQNNGATDLNKMGLNMLGIAMKSGEPNKTVTITLRDWSDRVEEGAYTDDGYVANVVKYTFLNDGLIQEQIQFVKNFNALSQRVKVMREKRLSNISSELLAHSEDILMNYFYFSATNFSNNELYPNNTKSFITISNFNNMLFYTFTSNLSQKQTIDFATLENQEEKLIAYNNLSKNDNALYIPLIKYGAGNCICFEMNYDHPINAGNYTLHSITGWWQNSTYFTGASFYTDTNGEFVECTIKLYSQSSQRYFDEYFPNIEINDITPLIKIEDYKVYKQPNEIFGLNFEMCFIGKDIQNEFVGQGFITKNAFIQTSEETYYFYYSTDEYDILDQKTLGSSVEITSVSVSMLGDAKSQIQFSFNSTSLTNIKSWAIGDKNGNIYFAFNEELNGTYTSKNIYFYSSGNDRIK